MLGLGKLGVVRDIEGTATRRGRDGLDPRPADLVAAPPSLILSGSEWRRKLDDGLGAMVTNDLAWPPARRRRDVDVPLFPLLPPLPSAIHRPS